MAAAGSPLRKFGLTWLRRYASALLYQYKLLPTSGPDQLLATAAQTCLGPLLDILVPLLSHSMQQLDWDSCALHDCADWAATMLE